MHCVRGRITGPTPPLSKGVANVKGSKRVELSYCHIRSDHWPDPEVIKLFPCSNQLSMKFIVFINVKMPTIVGILAYINMINTTSECLKARRVNIFSIFVNMSS